MLKQFDLFPRLREESRRTTSEGGVISLVGICLALALIINEIVDFTTVHTVEHFDLFDAHGVPRDMAVHLEIDFFHLTCQQISFGFASKSMSEEAEEEQDEEGNAMQPAWELKSKSLLSSGEGCVLSAEVQLHRYESGEMHVALDPTVLDPNRHGDGNANRGAFTLEDYFDFNTSHHLRHFSFASALHPESRFAAKVVREGGGTGRFVYDFTVVPEMRRRREEKEEEKEQEVGFLLQCREQNMLTKTRDEGVHALQRLGLPGVFFSVKMSSLMIDSAQVHQPWYVFFINVLGIAAGVPALVALVDSTLHEALWKRKLD